MAGKNSHESSHEPSKLSSSKHTPNKQGKAHATSITNSDVPQVEKDLALEALTEFNKCNYSQAQNALVKLENMRPKDVKVLHNKAVCEFYKSGLVHKDAFSKVLTDILAQSANGKGHGRLPEWPGSVESSVAVLNLAILAYHEQQYSRAIELLTPLYAALESLEESVGISACLVLASCYLCCSRPDNTLSVLRHAEATFLPQPLPPSEEQQQHTPVPASPARTPTPASRDRGSVGAAGTPAGLSGEKASRSGSVSAVPSGGSSGSEGSASQAALRRRLVVLRVRALVSMRFLKLSAKEFKAAILQAAAAGHDLELSQVCIKSQIKLLRGQPHKALKVLNTCVAIPSNLGQTGSSKIRRDWPSLDVWYYNNLAIIHMGLNKPALAMVYLDKAVAAYKQDSKVKGKEGGPLSLYNNGARINSALSYNLGCILLHLNRSEAMARRAFDLFIEVHQWHPCNPRLWLQLAQCCITVHQWKVSETGEMVTAEELGSGPSARLLLRLPQQTSPSEPFSDAAFPEARLPFARLCLLNALKLLPTAGTDLEDQEALSCAGLVGGGEAGAEVFPADPSLPLRAAEAARVRCAVLCCAAYTFLCLGEYQQALGHATALLAALPTPDSTAAASWAAAHPALATYRSLGNLYASECCVMLNKMNDAIKYLDLHDIKEVAARTTNSENKNEEAPFTPGSSLKTPQSLQAVIRFNLSIVYAMRHNFDKSTTLLNEVWGEQPDSKPPALVMLAIYLHLKQGSSEKARKLVVDHIGPLRQ